MFSIVEFKCEGGTANEVGVAPSCWIQGDECLWPPFKNPDSIRAAVKKCVRPKDAAGWKLWKVIRIMKKFDSYDLARKNLSKATYTSDFSECDTPKRVSKRAELFSPDDSNKPKKIFKETPNVSKPLPLPPPPRPPTAPPNKGPDGNDGNSSILQSTGLSSNLQAENEALQFDPGFIFDLNEVEEILQTEVLTNPSANEAQLMGEVVQRASPKSCEKPPLSFERFMIEEMVAMKSLLTDISNTVNLLVVPEHAEKDTLEFEEGEFDTANSIDDLEGISAKCNGDKSYRQKLINHLGSIRGSSCVKVLNRMLRELLTDEVAANYSYKGQRDKRSFEVLRFKPVLSACLKLNPFTRKERLTFDIDAGVMAWLKRASTRMANKGRKNPRNVNSDDETWEDL